MLTHLFALAVEWEIVPVSPAQRREGAEAAGGARAISAADRTQSALLEALPRMACGRLSRWPSRPGMRRGEILGLRYLDVDLSNRRIMLPQTKNGDKPRCLSQRHGGDGSRVYCRRASPVT